MFEFRKSFSVFPFLITILLIYGNLKSGVYAKRGSNAGVYFEDFQIDYINESYVDLETFDVSIDYRPDGKNAIKYYADLPIDPPKDMRMKCTASARVFGNYVPTGLSVDGEMCQAVGPMREYIDRLLEPLGFHCPITKGIYQVDGYVIDLSGLPINLISGTHLLFDILLYVPDGTQVMALKAYVVL